MIRYALHLAGGERQEADALLDQLEDLAKVSPGGIKWVAAYCRAGRAMYLGEFALAEGLIEAAQKLEHYAPLLAGFLGPGQRMWLAYHQGEFEKAARILAPLMEHPWTLGTFAKVAPALFPYILGDLETARRAFATLEERGVESLPQDESWFVCMRVMAEMCEDLELESLAGKLFVLLEPHEGKTIFQDFLFLYSGTVESTLALLSAAMNEEERALAYYERALGREHEIGSLPGLIQTRYFNAKLLHRQWSRASKRNKKRDELKVRAVGLLKAARNDARRIGFGRRLDDIKALLEKFTGKERGA